MSKPFPPDFRQDVNAVARKGEASISQIAHDFGISETCLQRWLKIADREDGLAPSTTGERWATREELRLAIITCIERTYHRRRCQRRLGRLSPVE